MKYSMFFILVLALALQGCTTFTPIPEGYSGPLSTIVDTSEVVSPTKVYFFELVKVDGRNISSSSYETRILNDGAGFSLTPVISKRAIPSGKSILSIRGVTHYAAPILALGGGNFSIKGEVEIELLAEKTYLVKGELTKLYSAVWVEDELGNVVAEKIEKKK